jgi:hypothetical protein
MDLSKLLIRERVLRPMSESQMPVCMRMPSSLFLSAQARRARLPQRRQPFRLLQNRPVRLLL